MQIIHPQVTQGLQGVELALIARRGRAQMNDRTLANSHRGKLLKSLAFRRPRNNRPSYHLHNNFLLILKTLKHSVTSLGNYVDHF